MVKATIIVLFLALMACNTTGKCGGTRHPAAACEGETYDFGPLVVFTGDQFFGNVGWVPNLHLYQCKSNGYLFVKPVEKE